MLKISVVTPSYNQGIFIERTLKSVLDQQYPELEYFVFDGGSTDQTVSILERYSSQLTYWQSQKDKGQSDAINQGWRRSSGEVICWLNSDDMFYPGALAYVARYFEDHPEVDVLYGESQLLDVNDRFISNDAVEDFSLAELLRVHFIPQPSMFFRRAVLERGLFLDVDLHCQMDRDLIIRMALAGFRFVHCRQLLSQVHYHQTRKSDVLAQSSERQVNCSDREFVDIFERNFNTQALKDQYGTDIAHGLMNRCETRYALYDPLGVRFLAEHVLRTKVTELHPRARMLLRNSYLPPNVMSVLRAGKRVLRGRASA